MSIENAPTNIPSIERNGVQYIPLRTLVEQLGGTIKWDNEAKKAYLAVRGHSAEVNILSRSAIVNGVESSLSETPFVEEGSLYAPVNFLDQLGLTHT
jgi:hypothetical protein